MALCTTTGVTLALSAYGESVAAVVNNQPVRNARAESIITVKGEQFKDLNANGKLDPYEDWRLTAEERSADLVSQMTLQEKAGMLMIDTLNAGFGGSIDSKAMDYVVNQRMNRFILRSVASAAAESCDGPPAIVRGGYIVTPQQLAAFSNAIQEIEEGSPLGIPAVVKDNAARRKALSARPGRSGTW